jgi:hypothetical protein
MGRDLEGLSNGNDVGVMPSDICLGHDLAHVDVSRTLSE